MAFVALNCQYTYSKYLLIMLRLIVDIIIKACNVQLENLVSLISCMNIFVLCSSMLVPGNIDFVTMA